MTTIFSERGFFQQQVNSPSYPPDHPGRPGNVRFVWTHSVFEEDSPEMSARAVCGSQSFLARRAFVSGRRNGEVIECSQDGLGQGEDFGDAVELARGTEVGNTDHMVHRNLDPWHVSLLGTRFMGL